MSAFAGPQPIPNGLVFGIDPANPRNLVNAANGFFTNINFANGAGITQESGSNPTNEIVEFPNPGTSQYCLRQSAGVPYTEYQINLTTELVANTTYCMSGWYAESSDYSCADGSRMFHARTFSSSGAHQATGVGIGTTIVTKVVNGITWRYCYELISTPADYSNSFNWYVGYGGSNYTGYRYYTNLKMELGSFPSGIDLSGQAKHVSVFNGAALSAVGGGYLFDGSNDYLSGSSSIGSLGTGDWTISCWWRSNGAQSNYVALISQGFTGSPSNGSWAFKVSHTSGDFNFTYCTPTISDNLSSNNPNDDAWHHLVAIRSGTSLILYKDGVSVKSITLPGGQTFGTGAITYIGYNPRDNAYLKGYLANLTIHNTAWTANQLASSYNSQRGRFGV
jgi:hypothetical protein